MIPFDPLTDNAERVIQALKIQQWQAMARKKRTYLLPRCPIWLFRSVHDETCLWLKAEASIRRVR
ncbi:MAG: hypothetical protein AB7O68_16970 [Pirellulales bacterium]